VKPFGETDQFGGDALAGQIFQRADGRVAVGDQNPAGGLIGTFRVAQLGDFYYIGLGFQNPVQSGQAGVERAVGDVGRHFLRAHQRAADFGVVDGGEIVPAMGTNGPAGD